MPIEGTRRTKIGSTNQPEPTDPAATAKMADKTTKDEDLPDRELLLKILSNQKSSEAKSEERFSKLTKQASSSKKAFDSYKEENDKEIATIKSDISKTLAELKELQEKVKSLETKIDATSNNLDESNVQIVNAKKEIKAHTKTLGKLDHKYERDDEELRRCSLIIDGINERDNKRPKVVVENLLNDLGADWKEGDIKSTYRLGPIKPGVSRPRSIKVIFSNVNVKGEIFRNIEKMSRMESWKGVRLADAISRQEQLQQRDLRCIFAAAKSRGINVKLRGSTIIIDDIKYTYKDIDSLPHGLSMENVKIVKVSDGYAFQSHFAFLSNMFPCEIKDDDVIYKSAEHYYSADMARHHNRMDLIEDILRLQRGSISIP